MKYKIQLSFLLLFVSSFIPSHADDSEMSLDFIEHGLSVSRAQSAFYMYGQTDGESHYKKEYEQHLFDAEKHLLNLKKTQPKVAARLLEIWSRILPLIRYEFDEYAGYYVPGLAQSEWRGYLNAYYSEYKVLPLKISGVTQKLKNTQLKMEVVMARFFDLASSPFIDEGRFEVDRLVVDSSKMSMEIKKELSILVKLYKDTPFSADLKSISKKWKFIEESVTNGQKKPAFILVYYNKNRIEKLFESSGNIMLRNNF